MSGPVRRLSSVFTATVLASLALTGCTQDPGRPIRAVDLLGKSLSSASAAAPDDVGQVVQDLGQSFGVEPTYDSTEWGSSRFTIIAACSDSPDVRSASEVQVGVVESQALTTQQLADARDGRFSEYIRCPKGYVG